MPQDVIVEIATESTPALVAAFAQLLPQLSKSAVPPTQTQIAEMINSPATEVLVAYDGESIVGLLTFVVFRIPSGVRAWIEDVVVDDAARGRGVGEALSRAAVGLAAEKGARTIELTSRPAREAANRLYGRLGFVARETNVYRYTL